MLKASPTKIKSALKPGSFISRHRLLTGLLFVVLLWALWPLAFHSSPMLPRRSLVINNATYQLEIASTPEQQIKGLSGRKAMPDWSGMLFSYPDEAERCMWMKDMRYAIDILWVGSDRKITHLEQGLTPETYPKTYCFKAQYVIELSAGEAVQHRLRAGQTLEL